MREITTHHDGHGLLDLMTVHADGPGPGGASHRYEVTMPGMTPLVIQFQRGPRHEEGSTPGVLEPALLAIIADRLGAFLGGSHPSVETAVALDHVEQAMEALRARADARAERGVLGSMRQ